MGSEEEKRRQERERKRKQRQRLKEQGGKIYQIILTPDEVERINSLSGAKSKREETAAIRDLFKASLYRQAIIFDEALLAKNDGESLSLINEYISETIRHFPPSFKEWQESRQQG